MPPGLLILPGGLDYRLGRVGRMRRQLDPRMRILADVDYTKLPALKACTEFTSSAGGTSGFCARSNLTNGGAQAR